MSQLSKSRSEIAAARRNVANALEVLRGACFLNLSLPGSLENRAGRVDTLLSLIQAKLPSDEIVDLRARLIPMVGIDHPHASVALQVDSLLM